jgi:hypothetical protein
MSEKLSDEIKGARSMLRNFALVEHGHCRWCSAEVANGGVTHKPTCTVSIIELALEERDRLREALGMFNKWFDNSGAAISARWDRVPPEERVAIVKAFRALVRP